MVLRSTKWGSAVCNHPEPRTPTSKESGSMSDTTRNGKPRQVKPLKPARLLKRLDARGQGGVAVLPGSRGDEDCYWIDAVPSDWGAAYRVQKFGTGETYSVCLDGEGGTCGCKGYEHTGHCRHITGLLQLQAEGALGLPRLPELPAWSSCPLGRCRKEGGRS